MDEVIGFAEKVSKDPTERKEIGLKLKEKCKSR